MKLRTTLHPARPSVARQPRGPADLGISFLDKGRHDIRPRPRPARDRSRRDRPRAAATGSEPGSAATTAVPTGCRHGARRRRCGGSRGARRLAGACAADGRGPRPTGRRPQCPVPPDRTGGGVAFPLDTPRQAAAARLCHLTSPTHRRRGSSTCRYLVDRHPCGDASDPTAHRARPSRSPRLPVQACPNAARRRFRIDLRCHRPRYDTSKLSAARLSPGTSQSHGARTVPSRRNRGPVGRTTTSSPLLQVSLHSGQSGLDHP